MDDQGLAELVERTLTAAAERARRALARKRARRAVARTTRGATRKQLKAALAEAVARLSEEPAEHQVALSLTEAARQLGYVTDQIVEGTSDADAGRKRVERLIAAGLLDAQRIPGCNRWWFDRRQLSQHKTS